MSNMTYADGFGDWHSTVPACANSGTGALTRARRNILAELVARERTTGETDAECRYRLGECVALIEITTLNDTAANFVSFMETTRCPECFCPELSANAEHHLSRAHSEIVNVLCECKE